MTPQRILAVYYGIAGLYTLAASLTWGINTLFLLAAGLDILQVFIANATYTAGIVLFEIPTGVLADTRGRRVSCLLSVLVLGLANAIYVGAAWSGAGWGIFCLGALAFGLGATFYSGAVEAWLVDALQEAGHRGPLDRVLARGHLVTGWTTLLGTACGGLLASLDLSLPYLLRIALGVPLFVLAFFAMEEAPSTPSARRRRGVFSEMKHLAHAGVAYGWQRPAVRWLLLVGFLHYGFLTWAFHAWQPYFLELWGRHAPWVAGVVSALVALATMAGNALVARLASFHGRRTSVLLAAAGVQTAAAVAVGLAGSFWLAVAFLLVTAAATGVVGPVKQAFLHRLIPSEQRATVISFDSLLANAGGICGQTGLGAYARERDIAGGYVVGGLATVLALPLLLLVHRLAHQEDAIGNP